MARSSARHGIVRKLGYLLLVLSMAAPAKPLRQTDTVSKKSATARTRAAQTMRPGISLELDNYQPTVGTKVTATVTLQPSVATARCLIDWDDNEKADCQSSLTASHSYAAARTYKVSVQALAGHRNLAAEKFVTVIEPKPELPAPQPSYTLVLEAESRLEAGSPGTFTANLTPAPPAETEVTYKFIWDKKHSDEYRSRSDTLTTSHVFGSPDQYKVTAVATVGNIWEVQGQTIQIDVFAVSAPVPSPPTIRLTAEPDLPLLRQSVQFTIRIDGQLPTNGAVSYCFSWEKESKEFCQESPSAPHAFLTSGIHTVSAAMEQNGNRFAAEPLDITVEETPRYQVSLNPRLFRSETGKQIDFAAELSPFASSRQIEYCFLWGDGKRDCVNQPFARHAFASRGSYFSAVELFIDGQKVARSPSSRIEISWPVWIAVILWGGAIVLVLIVGYRIWRRAGGKDGGQPSKPPVLPEPRIVLSSLPPSYRMAVLKAPPKCLVRIRWVQKPSSGSIMPKGNLIKKKGSAHA